VQAHPDGKFSVQTFQELEKLLMTMPGVTLPYDLALGQMNLPAASSRVSREKTCSKRTLLYPVASYRE
jgi:hypothetical protein